MARLGELIDRFKGRPGRNCGILGAGPNKPCTPLSLNAPLDPRCWTPCQKQTGLSRDELLSRLCRELPDAVDKYTPQGKLPSEAEFSRA